MEMANWGWRHGKERGGEGGADSKAKAAIASSKGGDGGERGDKRTAAVMAAKVRR